MRRAIAHIAGFWLAIFLALGLLLVGIAHAATPLTTGAASAGAVGVFGRHDRYWPNVGALVTGNGAAGATIYERKARTAGTVSGNTTFSTAQSKFGGSSIAFDGVGDYLLFPTSSAFNIQSGDFTIEAWVYPTGNSGTRAMAGQWDQSATGTAGWLLLLTSTAVIFDFGPFSTASTMISGSATLTLNAWSHIAVTRSGSTFTLWLNGASIGTATSAATATDTGVALTFANWLSSSHTFPASGSTDFAGNIGGFRITKGVARYSSAFTPPAAPFPVH